MVFRFADVSEQVRSGATRRTLLCMRNDLSLRAGASLRTILMNVEHSSKNPQNSRIGRYEDGTCSYRRQ